MKCLYCPPRIIGPFGTPSKFVLDALKSICAKFGAFFQSLTISPSNHESIKYFKFLIILSSGWYILMVILRRRRTGGQGDGYWENRAQKGYTNLVPRSHSVLLLGCGRSGHEIRGIRKGKRERAGIVSSKRVESGRNRGKLRNNICLIFRNRKGLHKRWKPREKG